MKEHQWQKGSWISKLLGSFIRERLRNHWIENVNAHMQKAHVRPSRVE